MRVVDLFSGLGGASEAFVNRGHEVTRYENDERFRNVPFTIIKDVRILTVEELSGVDIILAGFPCQHFSNLANHTHWPKGVPTEATREMIAFVQWVVLLIKEANPTYWIIENPMGMMRRRDVLGSPTVETAWCAWYNERDEHVKDLEKPPKKPTDLWGKLPPIDWKMPLRWQRAPRGSKKGLCAVKDSAQRALWPYAFSLAVCLAAEGNSAQTTLYDHLAQSKDVQSDTSLEVIKE